MTISSDNGLDEVLSIDVNDICYDAFFCLICFLYSDFKINLGDIPESAILDTVYAGILSKKKKVKLSRQFFEKGNFKIFWFSHKLFKHFL